MGYKVAVVGATGNVGREMLTILAEREFPAGEYGPSLWPEESRRAALCDQWVSAISDSIVGFVVLLGSLIDTPRSPNRSWRP